MELEESTCLTSDYTSKLQSSRQYGTGTKTEIQINGTKQKAQGQIHTPMNILSLTKEAKIQNREKTISLTVVLGKLREGNGTPLQYSCLENPMDGGAWKAAVHGVAEGRTLLSDFTFTFHSHALEKEMANHSSVLAWRIPGTGEPHGLLSMGSHRVGHY